ncbi:MAG: DUF3667 domain-containing protein [Gammaproteobacteria bacterium]
MVKSTSGHSAHPRGSCLNCNATLSGRYCHECGQAAHVRGLSMRELLNEFVNEIYYLESRTWRSLLPLLFRPGRITDEYLGGRRARYVTPLRLYLTASVLFFVVAAITGNTLRLSWGDPDVERQILEATSDTDQTGLVMKLLYPLSGRYYVEHLLFFLHYHAFGFLLLTLLILCVELGQAIAWLTTPMQLATIAGSVYLPVYLFVAMRRVYGQGRTATSVKYLLLALAYIIGLAISFAGVVLFTALRM